MSEYIHLIGSEEVSRAGYSIRSAAEDMRRAGETIDNAFFIGSQRADAALDRLDGIVARFEAAVERLAERQEVGR